MSHHHSLSASGSSCGHAHGEACHGHDHSHDGHHHHAPIVTSANERAVLLGLLLTASFMVAEVIGGLLSGSLALIADAGHMLTDAVALGLAWAGFVVGRKASDARRTYGYMRAEVLAGLFNAVSLFALVGWIAYEAIRRFMAPVDVLAGPMLAVAVIGLLVNILVFWILSRADRGHVNIRGAMVHVLGDLLGSVAAIVAAVVIYLTGWSPIDPILSVLVCLLLVRSAWALARSAVGILMEAAPSHLNLAAIQERLTTAAPGVAAVNHLHVWSITSGKLVATLDVVLDETTLARPVLTELRRILKAEYGIDHVTIEPHWIATNKCALFETGNAP
jgi:cobalt-zinc-cadmium efflux system protein